MSLCIFFDSINEVLSLNCDGTSVAQVLERLGGVYTTARTYNRTHFVQYDVNANRICESLRVLGESTHSSSPLERIEVLEPLFKRMLSTVCDNLEKKLFQSGEAISNIEYKLTFAVVTFNVNAALNELISLSSNFTFLQQYQTKDKDLGYLMISHASVLPEKRRPPIQVLASTKVRPRDQPTAKATNWVLSRPDVSAVRSQNQSVLWNLEEILLLDENEFVYEGTQTNFFSLLQPAQLTFTLQTARGVVLEGTILRLLLTVIDALPKKEINSNLFSCLPTTPECYLKVDFVTPSLNEVDSWVACALTSTSRLVMPIDEIYFDKGEQIKKLKHFETIHPAMAYLAKAVESNVKESCKKIRES
jgi:branched-subunit amino acid aminotransferase/4-amino-4-deoxychorismate lyase